LAYFAGFDETLDLFVKSLPGKILGDEVKSFGGAKIATQKGIVATLEVPQEDRAGGKVINFKFFI
jgi:hypothetical protein